MRLHEADRRQLVVQPEIPLPAVFLFDLRVREIPQDTDPVVDEDRDDPAFRVLPAAERLFRIRAGVEAAAVNEDDDRTVFRLLRRVNVQIQAVLVIVEGKPVPELLMVKAPHRIFQLREIHPVLRAGRAEGGCVKLALPAAYRLRVAEALRPRIRYAEEFISVFRFPPDQGPQ